MLETSALCRLLVEHQKNGFSCNVWLIIEEYNCNGYKNLHFRTTSEPQAASLVQLHDIPRIKRALERTGQYNYVDFEYSKIA